MKTWLYSSIGFSAFSLCILLGHLSAAYPPIRSGVNALIVAVLIAIVVLACLSLAKVKLDGGDLVERSDYVASLLSSGAIALVAVFALLVGAFVVGG